jgi:hypothetical protein
MNEQELVGALRDLIAKASLDAPDPRLLAREIRRHDQQRIRLLAGLSIFFWLLAAAGLVLLCIGLDRFVIYVRIADNYPVVRPSDMEEENGPDAPRHTALSTREVQMLNGTQLLHQSIWIIAGSVASLFLGALCTVLLVTTSRRATLRQINISLMGLSEQLKQVRQAAHPEALRKPGNS